MRCNRCVGRMEVDLLLTKCERQSATRESDALHPQDFLVESASGFDVPHREDEVIESNNVHVRTITREFPPAQGEMRLTRRRPLPGRASLALHLYSARSYELCVWRFRAW